MFALEHSAYDLSLELDTHSSIPITGCCNGSRIHLNVTSDEFTSLFYGHTPPWLADKIPSSCGFWRPYWPEYEERNTYIIVKDYFNFQPSDPSWARLPDTDLRGTEMGMPMWKKSHLLSLPKELRLEIWKWTLTDPSVPELVVNIGRIKKEACEYKAIGTAIPKVLTWLQPGRNAPIGLALLRTNRSIYEEALPLLYRSVRFTPADHQGIFPLFLDSLSPYARSLIRHVKLHVPRQIYDVDIFGDPGVPLFHWAVTCAQVAKLDGQLKDVEIEGLWTDTGALIGRTKYSVLNPLCKIKTKKISHASNDGEAERLLAEVEAETKARKSRAAAEARTAAEVVLDRFRPEEEGSPSGIEPQSKHVSTPDRNQHQGATARRPHPLPLEASILESALNVSTVVDETLMDEWDMISYKSGVSTPRDRPPSYVSRRSSNSWSDAASIIAEARVQDLFEVDGKTSSSVSLAGSSQATGTFAEDDYKQ